LAEFKALVREQFNILLIDEDAALSAIPAMLPEDAEPRHGALSLIKQVLGARGELTDTDREKLDEVERLFGVGEGGRTPAQSIGRSRAERRAAGHRQAIAS